MFKLLLISMFLTACGTKADDFIRREVNPKPPAYSIDPVMQPMIDQFMDDAHAYDADTSRAGYLRIAEFAEIGRDQVVGVCSEYTFSNGELSYLQVTIRPDFAERLDSPSYAGLMYHELGHCILNLEHSETGIMAPVMYSESYYEENWDELVEELFTGE